MLKRSSVCAALLLMTSAALADPRLPRPQELEPNVQFWSRIYSEQDGNGGLIHDNRHLDVVYEAARFTPGQSRRSRERQVEKEKTHLKQVLLQLARGKRTNLSAEQARILALWPDGVTNQTLKDAAYRLRFQLGQADKFRAGLERQGAWRPHIEKSLADQGVPRNLIALPHVESSYNPAAYSQVGAAGLWQFTRSTGRLYLRVDHVVDERLDPYKATVAAARLLSDNYRHLDSWPLAITAYNHGVGGMRRAIRKLGTKDIATIVHRYKSRTFGFASRNFYSEFLAADQIDRHPERYFGAIQRHSPVAHEQTPMPHFYRVSTLERALGIDRETLRRHNPSLRPAVWNESKFVPKGYSLRIPASPEVRSLSVAVAAIPESERLAKQHRDRLYTVRRGDTLSTIARRQGVSVSQLVSVNNLRSRHRIRAGQVLALPDDARGGSARVARQAPPSDGMYTVRRGDNVSKIARRFDVSERQIAAWNGLRNRNRIHPGQRLRVSAPSESTAAVVAVASADVSPPKAAAPQPPVAPPPAPSQDASSVPVTSAPTGAAALVAAVELTEPEPTAEPEETPDPLPSESVPEETEPQAVEATVPEPPGPASVALSAPPPDSSAYAVGADGRILVQPEETLGHYADWLDVPTSRLRRLNGMRSGSTVVIGRKTKLDFSRVDAETFERRRLEYHHMLQAEFFQSWEVTGTEVHTMRDGDTLWYLALRRYKVPIWLLQQYNPDVDFGSLHAGTRLVIPRLESRA